MACSSAVLPASVRVFVDLTEDRSFEGGHCKTASNERSYSKAYEEEFAAVLLGRFSEALRIRAAFPERFLK